MAARLSAKGSGGAGHGELAGAAQEGAAGVGCGIDQVHRALPYFWIRYSGDAITISTAA